jgi:hypothetical protein
LIDADELVIHVADILLAAHNNRHPIGSAQSGVDNIGMTERRLGVIPVAISALADKSGTVQLDLNKGERGIPWLKPWGGSAATLS